MLLSIVLTTHYRPLLLARALDSIVRQADAHFEIIVCSDESSKETLEVCTSRLRPQDSLVICPHLKGPAESRNYGMTLARGDWLGFLDDDDTFVPGFFAEFLKLVNAADGQCFYFNYNRVSEVRSAGAVNPLSKMAVDLSVRSVDNLAVKNFIPNNAIFANRKLASGCLFDPSLRSHEDWDWILSMKNIMSLKFLNLYGSNVHIDESERSRNRLGDSSVSVGLDYLTIYRRWPGETEEIQNQRMEKLRVHGIQIAANLL